MYECANCGGHVTPDYRRVFAGPDGVVHGCPACRVDPVPAGD